jgi:hypothetical protein
MLVDGGGGDGVFAMAMMSSGCPRPRLQRVGMATAAMAVFVGGGGMEPTATTTVQWLLMPPPPSAAMVVIVVNCAAMVDAAATILSLSLTVVAKETRARVWWQKHWRWWRWQGQAVGHHLDIVVDSGSKDFIASAIINRHCSQR